MAKKASEIIPQRSELDADAVIPVRLISLNYVSAINIELNRYALLNDRDQRAKTSFLMVYMG